MQRASLTRLWQAAWLALAALALPGRAVQAAPTFDVQAINFPADPYGVCELIGFSDTQWIVVDCDFLPHIGFHRTPQQPWQRIPEPPGAVPGDFYINYLRAANNLGVAVGVYKLYGASTNVAYRWSQAGGYQSLERATADGVMAVYDINDAGIVVGQEGKNAMMWAADGSVSYRDPQPYHRSYFGSFANNVNLVGEVTAVAEKRGAGLWTAAEGRRALRVDGHRVHFLTDINNPGQVVGSYYVEDADDRRLGIQRVRVNRDGSYLPFGAPQRGTDGWKLSRINDAGQVVYLASGADPYVSTTYYWDDQSGAHKLTTLINPANPLSGRVDLSGYAHINNLGQILATGTDKRTGRRALFLFTPVAP